MGLGESVWGPEAKKSQKSYGFENQIKSPWFARISKKGPIYRSWPDLSDHLIKCKFPSTCTFFPGAHQGFVRQRASKKGSLKVLETAIKQVLRRILGAGVRGKKGRNVQKRSENGFVETFRTSFEITFFGFFGTPGPEAPRRLFRDFFEIFEDFWASGSEAPSLRWANSRESYRRIASESYIYIYMYSSASVHWLSYLPQKHRIWSSLTLRSLHCDLSRAIGVRWCSIRSTWTCGMACES